MRPYPLPVVVRGIRRYLPVVGFRRGASPSDKPFIVEYYYKAKWAMPTSSCGV